MKTSILLAFILCFFVAVFTSSCVIVHDKKDNGKHKGWYKNPKNPHHPATTNPWKGNKKK